MRYGSAVCGSRAHTHTQAERAVWRAVDELAEGVRLKRGGQVTEKSVGRTTRTQTRSVHNNKNTIRTVEERERKLENSNLSLCH